MDDFSLKEPMISEREFASMQPTGPTIGELRELVQKAIRGNPRLTSRLEKAAFLLLLRPIVSLGESHFRVGSEDGLRDYEVVKGHCQCSDYLRHGESHPCKHRLALMLLCRLGRRESGGLCSGQGGTWTSKAEVQPGP